MIVLVRHGETESNFRRVLQVPETPLSSFGLTQAERVGARLREFSPTLILCSDLLRARMTAEAIVAHTGARVEFSPLLQERNFGALRGMPYAALGEDPFAPDLVPPGGESWEAFYARAAEALQLVTARRRAVGGNLVVVTHGLMCRALVQRHVLCAEGQVVPERFDNTGVSLLEPEPPHRARLINCCGHLLPSDVREPGAPV